MDILVVLLARHASASVRRHVCLPKLPQSSPLTCMQLQLLLSMIARKVIALDDEREPAPGGHVPVKSEGPQDMTGHQHQDVVDFLSSLKGPKGRPDTITRTW